MGVTLRSLDFSRQIEKWWSFTKVLTTYFEYGRNIREKFTFKHFCKFNSSQDCNGGFLELITLNTKTC